MVAKRPVSEKISDLISRLSSIQLLIDSPTRKRLATKRALEDFRCRYLHAKPGMADGGSRPDIQQWQTDQSEFFDGTILEIVSEYAEWRDKKENAMKKENICKGAIAFGTGCGRCEQCHAELEQIKKTELNRKKTDLAEEDASSEKPHYQTHTHTHTFTPFNMWPDPERPGFPSMSDQACLHLFLITSTGETVVLRWVKALNIYIQFNQATLPLETPFNPKRVAEMEGLLYLGIVLSPEQIDLIGHKTPPALEIMHNAPRDGTEILCLTKDVPRRWIVCRASSKGSSLWDTGITGTISESRLFGWVALPHVPPATVDCRVVPDVWKSGAPTFHWVWDIETIQQSSTGLVPMQWHDDGSSPPFWVTPAGAIVRPDEAFTKGWKYIRPCIPG